MDDGLFDDVPLLNRERDKAWEKFIARKDVPLMNKERDDSWEAFIKRKDVKAMFSEQGFGFPLNRGYYDLWCIAWAKAWDKGFHEGRKKHD